MFYTPHSNQLSITLDVTAIIGFPMDIHRDFDYRSVAHMVLSVCGNASRRFVASEDRKTPSHSLAGMYCPLATQELNQHVGSEL